MSSSDQLQPSHGTLPSATIVDGAAKPFTVSGVSLPHSSPIPGHLAPVDVAVSCDPVIPHASLPPAVEDEPPNTPADEPCAAGPDSLDPSKADTELAPGPLDPPPDARGSNPVAPARRTSPPPNARARTDAPPPSNEAPVFREEAVRGAQDAPGSAVGGDQGGEPPADATTEADAPQGENPAPAALPSASGVAPEPQGAPDDALAEIGLDGFDGPDLEAMPVPDGKTIQYTMVANVVLNRWPFLLTLAESSVLSFIIRQTHGFHRARARIALKQFHDGIFNQNGETVHNGAGISISKAKEALDELEFYGLIVVQRRKNPNGSDAESEYYITNQLIDGWRNFPSRAERIKARKERVMGGRGHSLATRGQPLATRGGRGQPLATRGQPLTSTGGQPLAPKKNTKETRTKKKSTDSHFPSSPKTENLHTEEKAKQEQGLKVKTMAAAAPVPPQPRNEFREGFRGRIFAAIIKAFPRVYSEENRAAIEACCDHPIFVANWRTIIHKNRRLTYGDMWPFKKKGDQWNFVKIHQRTYDSQLAEVGYNPLELTPWESFSDHKMALEFRAKVVGLLGQPEFQDDDWDSLQGDNDDGFKEDGYDKEFKEDAIDALEQRVTNYEELSPEKRYSTRRKDLEDRAAGWLKKPELLAEWNLRLQKANPLDHGPLDWLAQRMIGGKKKFDDREEQLLDRARAVEGLPQEFWNAWWPRQDEAESNGWDQRALGWLEQQVVLAEQVKRSADELAGDERILAKQREDSPGDVELRRDGEHRPEDA